MSLLERLGPRFKADAHGLVDSLEDRRLVLRQCLREAETELSAKRARREALREERRRLDEEGERLDAACLALDADVELALEGGQEPLARFSARKLLELRAESERLARRGEQLGREATELEERLRAQEIELDSLPLRVRAALEREERSALDAPCGAVADEEVELELLRRRTSRKEGA